MIYYFIGWFVGIIVGSVFVIQPLIIIFFSIPYTIKLRKIEALSLNDPIMLRNITSFIVQVILCLLSYWIVSLFSHNLMIGFYVGVGMMLVFGLTKLGRNVDNVSDYMENNVKFIHPEFIKEYLNAYNDSQPDSKRKNEHIYQMIEKSNIQL